MEFEELLIDINHYTLNMIKSKGLHLIIDDAINIITIPIKITDNNNNNYFDSFEFKLPYNYEYEYKICQLLQEIKKYINNKQYPKSYIITKIKSESFMSVEINRSDYGWNDLNANITYYSRQDIINKGLSISVCNEIVNKPKNKSLQINKQDLVQNILFEMTYLIKQDQKMVNLVYGYIHFIENKNKLTYSVPYGIFILIFAFNFPTCPHGHLFVNKRDEINITQILMKKPADYPILPLELSRCGYKCGDYLRKRREYEKTKIRELENKGCKQDCALSMKWANEWRKWVHNKTNIIPQFIDNTVIFCDEYGLKLDLKKDVDFLMIPNNIWSWLIEIYGGGPKIVPSTEWIKMHNDKSV